MSIHDFNIEDTLTRRQAETKHPFPALRPVQGIIGVCRRGRDQDDIAIWGGVLGFHAMIKIDEVYRAGYVGLARVGARVESRLGHR
jgi:hypothetical protein